MKTTDHERVFDDAVRSRMRDDTWNLRMAKGVLKKRRRRIAVRAFAGAASLAAAASLVFTLTTAPIGGSPEGAALNSFVNAQVRGTWQIERAHSGSSGIAEPLLVDAELDEGLDAVISDALSRRL